MTTRLGDKLPVCGDKCCPFGYACISAQTGSPVCSLITDTSKTGTTDSSSSGRSSTTTTTTSPSATKSTTTSTSTPTTTSGVSSSAAHLEPKCNKFPIGVFLAGFFPGMFIGAFLMLAWVICSGRHHKPPSQRHSSGSSLIYKPTISDPIPLGSAGGMRTDFLRRTTGRAKSMFSTKSQQISPKYTESHWKMPTPPVPNNVPAAPVGVPVTPERSLAHEASSESIRVYSPPNNNGTVQPPVPAAIAPLRGMAAQRFPFTKTTNMGSPFKSPPNSGDAARYAADRDNNVRGMSVISGISELSTHNDRDHEILSPARYGGDGYTSTKRVRPDAQELVSRPTTTFTDMLHEAGFPDPVYDGGTPAVPKIPDGYSSKNRLRL
ncbi:hypothetical protein ABEF95_001244 [Exophiala dermatitidis]